MDIKGATRYFKETIDFKNINWKKTLYLSFRVETDPADHDHGQGEIIDYVKVPENLEPGYSTKLLKSCQMQCSTNCLSINREYILGFRWDCKCSPQVYRKLFKISFTTQSSGPRKTCRQLFLLFWKTSSCLLSFHISQVWNVCSTVLVI